MSTDSENGVEVRDGTSTGKVFYEDATKINVVEGHLHVYDSQTETVGIHAPGTWKTAKVKK